MAPKPEPARLAYVFGMVLAVGDHPSDHDTQFGCAERVTDLPSSTCACVLRRSTSFLPADHGRPPACCRHQRWLCSLAHSPKGRKGERG